MLDWNCYCCVGIPCSCAVVSKCQSSSLMFSLKTTCMHNLYAVNGWIKALRIAVICSTCFMWLKLVCCFFLALDACSTVAIHQWYGDKDFERNCGAGDSEKYAQFSQLHSFWRNLSWWSGRSALTSWITDRGGDSWN